MCFVTRYPRKRRLFAVSEPVLLAAKTSDKDFAYKYTYLLTYIYVCKIR